MKTSLFEHILRLSVADRIQLAEQIWDSIAATPEAIPLTRAQQEELHNRIAAYEQGPDAGVSWEQLKAKLQDRS
jgi:putative addiction module component (TIGR02574 family)